MERELDDNTITIAKTTMDAGFSWPVNATVALVGPLGPYGPQGQAGIDGSDATISIGAIGTATTNGATITSGVLSLAPADESNGGIVTNVSQTFGGVKTFADSAVAKGFRATDSVTTNGFRATGTATANSFVKSDGTSSQYLMADGSTSSGMMITSGSFSAVFLTRTITISYKLITDGTSKIVHLYIPAFWEQIFNYNTPAVLLCNSALPLSIRPSEAQVLPCSITNNRRVEIGFSSINTDGSIGFFLPPDAAWVNTGRVGTLSAQTITYVIN